MRKTTIIKNTTTALVGVALAASLAGCAGGNSAAEYIRAEGDELMLLTVDGNVVTHAVLDCEGIPDEDRTSSGELSANGTEILWTTSNGDFDSSDGTFDQRSDVTITESAAVIPYTVSARGYNVSEDRELLYVAADSSQGEAARAEQAEACTD